MHTSPVQVPKAGTYLTYATGPAALSAFIPDQRRSHVALRWPGTLGPEALAMLFMGVAKGLAPRERQGVRVWFEAAGDPRFEIIGFDDIRLMILLRDVSGSPFVRVEVRDAEPTAAPDVVVWTNRMTTQPEGLGASNDAIGVEVHQDRLKDVIGFVAEALSNTDVAGRTRAPDQWAVRSRLEEVLQDLRELRARRSH